MSDEPHEDARDTVPAVAGANPTVALEPVAATEPADAETPVAPEAAAPFIAPRVLTGDAQAAARGTLHGSIEHNTAARDRALNSGE